jgi:hypothetical protein
MIKYSTKIIQYFEITKYRSYAALECGYHIITVGLRATATKILALCAFFSRSSPFSPSPSSSSSSLTIH